MPGSLPVDVDSFLLDLEEQAKRMPLVVRRITGPNSRILGLSLLKRDPATTTASPAAPAGHPDHCGVTAEERLQLFRS